MRRSARAGRWVVDAHHHVWDVETCRHDWLAQYPTLGSRYDLVDYAAAAAERPVVGAVMVQAANDETESVRLLGLAAAAPSVLGVVGFVDLLGLVTGDKIADRIGAQQAAPGGELLVGLRQGATGTAALQSARMVSGAEVAFERGLVLDLLVQTEQLPAAAALVRRFPEGRFVVDHAAKPDIAHRTWQPWADQIAALASYQNVCVKLSGLVNEAGPGWDEEALRPYVAHLVQVFGPDRVVFGSDWPVCTVVASLAEVLDVTIALLGSLLAPDEVDQVLATNALDIYGLRVPAQWIEHRS